MNIPVSERHSPFYFFDQKPEYREAVKIIAGDRFTEQACTRRLVLSEIATTHGNPRFVIQLDSTPPIGWVIIPQNGDPVIRMRPRPKQLKRKESRIVRRLLANLREAVQ